MAYDINRLRQQAIFEQMPDIMGGMAGGGGGQTFEDPFQSSPTQFPPQQMQTAPQLPQQQRIPATPPVIRPTAQDSLRMPTPTMGMPQQPQSVDTDIQGLIDLANKFYTPQTRASDRFNTLLDSFPERGRPSLARSIVAGGIGIGSKNPLEDMEKYQYAPYYRDLAAWKEQAGPFQQGAQLENSGNTIERQLAGNLVTSAVAQRRAIEQARTAEAKQEEINRSNLAKEEAALIRARAYDFKQRNPNYKWDFSGTTIKVMGPDGIPRDTGMRTDKMAEIDRINLQNEGRVEVAQQQGANTAASNTQQGRDILQFPDGTKWQYNGRTQQWEQMGGLPSGQATRPGAAGTSGSQMNPNEAKQDRLNKIQAAIDSNPTWAKWYDSATGQIKPPPSGGLTGTSAQEKQEYDKFRKKIDPNYQSTYTKPPVNPQSRLLPATQREMEAASGGQDFNIPDIQIGDQVGPGIQSQRPPQYLSSKRLQLFSAKDGSPVKDGQGNFLYIDPTKENIAQAAKEGYRVKEVR